MATMLSIFVVQVVYGFGVGWFG